MKKEKKKPETEEVEKAEHPEVTEAETAEAAEAAPEDQAEKEPSAEEKLKEELNAEKDKYLRLRAEYDNYRKRTSAEKLQIYDDATSHAIKEILPLADSVTQALLQLEGKDIPEEFGKGLNLIAQQLKTSLEKLKVEPFCEIGDAFDPALHNAVSMTEDESLPANSIAAVYQKGYKIGDKIIRHAMVVVANA
jgi:molecular chaperone GrpE